MQEVESVQARVEQRRIEAALAAALKQLATRNELYSAAIAMGLDNVQASQSKAAVNSLREALPNDLLESISSATDLPFDIVAEALHQSMVRAVNLARADRMPLNDTMAAMQRLIQGNRVELFSRGLHPI